MPETVANLLIGAEPAGLTTAYQLAKAGAEVLVLEQDPQYVGGISRTAHYKGFLFDIGGHRFFSKSREVVDLWNEILPDDFIERPRLSRIYYGGFVVPMGLAILIGKIAAAGVSFVFNFATRRLLLFTTAR